MNDVMVSDAPGASSGKDKDAGVPGSTLRMRNHPVDGCEQEGHKHANPPGTSSGRRERAIISETDH
ncbi:MAG: hypothetical protein M1399_08685 [Actinobacteria bacterium]|nr:hypothetical protein [Actinomycetota bacterium]MCL5446293.1 hypothetical protein [Actinomycetota bacterium]